MFRRMIKSNHLLYLLIAILIAYDFQYFVRHYIMEIDEEEKGK